MPRRWRPASIVLILSVIAVLRVASTWTVFSATADEPAHAAAGMEVLMQHHYTLHLENTPMPRLVLMLVPWLSGSEYRTEGTVVQRGNSVIYSHGDYRTNLVKIRSGNLVFLLIAILFTWLWASESLGDVAGIAAVFLFTTQPVILGHAGLATTDMAATAGMAAALYAGWKWLEAPSVQRALWAGAAFGFAVNCKQSALLFVPVTWGAFIVVRLVQKKPIPVRLFAQLLIVAAVASLLSWAGYGFAVGSMQSVEPLRPDSVPQWLATLAIPAPRLFRGIVKLMEVDRNGFPAYLFGRSSMHGWWWYFPAAILLKTTIVTLVAAMAGFIARLRSTAEAAAAAIALLLFMMATHVDVGIRYALPLYVPLSLVASAGLVWSWEQWRVVAVVAIAWQCLTGLAHPDYFPYFNELAGREPSRYLLDSNLDWGQDLLRLEKELRRRNVRQFGFKYFGPADLKRHHLPPWYEIRTDRPARGWVAISEMFYRGVWYDGYHANRYPWLAGRKPVMRVGESIRLYYIP